MSRARTVLFWAIAVWLLLSPGLVQVLGLRPGIVRAWQMYSGSGKGICDVHYFSRTPDGDVPLPRLALLHPNLPLHRVGNTERRLELTEIGKVGRQLCRVAAVEDVRAHARCAGSRGWHVELRKETNLCLPSKGR